MGFEAAWLDQREPADHAARAEAPLFALSRWAAGLSSPLRAVDLGCGTGSTLRAVAPLLGEGQDWLLLDKDPALLAAARRRLHDWAGSGNSGEVLNLAGCGWSARVRLLRRDLRDTAALPLSGCDLVTASALLDLVSRSWLARLVSRLGGKAFYAALTFDGRVCFRPSDPQDEAILEAFLGHQRRDKGFGAALGPAADAVSAALFQAGSWQLVRAGSDWALGEAEIALQRSLLQGIAGAAEEQGWQEQRLVAGWLKRRKEMLTRPSAELSVGHRDLLAIPAAEPIYFNLK